MMLGKPKGALGAVAAGLILIAGLVTEGRAELSYNISLGAGAQMTDNLHLDPQTPIVADAENGESAASAASAANEESTADLRQPVEEAIFTVNPAITISWRAEHDYLRLRYNGEYMMLQGDEAQDPFWIHNIAAELSWRRWSPFFLEVRESRSRVPRTQEREDEAYVDQVDSNRLSLRTGLVSEIGSRSTVELSYGGELSTYSVVADTDLGKTETDPEIATVDPVAEGTDAGIDEFDRVVRQYGEALLRHRWNPLWGSELRVAYSQIDRELTSDYTELRASLTVDQRWSKHLALRYRLEWRREEDGKPVEKDPATETTVTPAVIEGVEETGTPVGTVRTNLLMAAQIRGDLERGGSWNLAYQDNMADQPDGDTLKTGRASAGVTIRARLGSTLAVGGRHETRSYRESGRDETAWGPTLGVRWLITPWSALDLVGSWTSTTIREEGLDKVEDRTTRASAGIVLMMFKRLQLDVGYGYRKNDSSDELRSYVNNIIFALLSFYFKPVGSGGLPVSAASSLVAGGTPSGGTQAAEGTAVAGSVP